MVCYDLEFPELVGEVARRGAQLIAAPSNWPAGVPVPAGERPVEVIKAQAAAAVNRIAIAVADRCGPERGRGLDRGQPDLRYATAILLAGPAAGEPALLWADVDLAAARRQAAGPAQRRFHRPPAGALRLRSALRLSSGHIAAPRALDTCALSLSKGQGNRYRNVLIGRTSSPTTSTECPSAT